MIRRWWATLRDLWNLRRHGWVAPNGFDEAITAAEWTAPPVFLDDGVTHESPKYIILYRGILASAAEVEVRDVLRELRLGNINHFQANAALYDVAVELGLPVLFWATTYEKYSGPVLEWND